MGPQPANLDGIFSEKQGNLPGMSIYFKPETIYERADGAAEVWQSGCGNFTSLFLILSDTACLSGLLCKKARTSPVRAASSKNPVWLTGKLQPVSISSARSAPARCLWFVQRCWLLCRRSSISEPQHCWGRIPYTGKKKSYLSLCKARDNALRE